MIYNWYLDGFGPQAITSKLNDLKISNSFYAYNNLYRISYNIQLF